MFLRYQAKSRLLKAQKSENLIEDYLDQLSGTELSSLVFSDREEAIVQDFEDWHQWNSDPFDLEDIL